MSHPSREDLLGYLLGALDGPDQERVADEVSHNPQLHYELTRLERCLERVGLVDEPAHFAPPVGLAERTCSKVASYRQTHVFPVRPSPVLPAGEQRASYTLWDLTAMAAVVVAAAALFFPALSSSRFQANLGACQNQLREIGMALQEYSSLQADQRFPQAAPDGNRGVAGIVAPILVDHKLIGDSRTFICPASPLAESRDSFQVPSLAVIDEADGDTLVQLQRIMGGSFGYNLGYQQDGQLQPVRDLRRPGYALLSDAPSNETSCRRSVNHGRIGQNVLYEDGHTAFVRGSCRTLADDPFHNLQGEVAAGLNPDDAVLGESAAHPLPVQFIKGR